MNSIMAQVYKNTSVFETRFAIVPTVLGQETPVIQHKKIQRKCATSVVGGVRGLVPQRGEAKPFPYRHRAPRLRLYRPSFPVIGTLSEQKVCLSCVLPWCGTPFWLRRRCGTIGGVSGGRVEPHSCDPLYVLFTYGVGTSRNYSLGVQSQLQLTWYKYTLILLRLQPRSSFYHAPE